MGVQSRYLGGLLVRINFVLIIRLFTFIYGQTSVVVGYFSSIYAAKEKRTPLVIKINKRTEALLKTV
jgi:hypothetical protein